ncbi:MAG: ornithine carbamoyltransferase [Chloroflexi bacterium]|nr:ornithine carbamoyltransferase [Chloroflexota bacterium]
MEGLPFCAILCRALPGVCLRNKDLLSISDLSSKDITTLIADAMDMKAQRRNKCLDGRALALLFEKPSLRTRVSFDMAMHQLGGHTIYLSPGEVGLGKREAVPDVARMLSRYVDIVAVRTFSHQTLEALARHATVPVINALSDLEHPCQALSDLLTIYERKGRLKEVTLAYVGDGNNVAQSLVLAAALAGMDFRIASPRNYGIQERILRLSRDYARDSGSEILCTEEPRQAVAGADVVYTDVWVSMGQEAEAECKQKAFAGYQVTEELLSLAREDAILMHPLPAHRGQEVTDVVLDSPQSIVFDQAENRMHLQKALLVKMLNGLSPC